MKNPYHVMAAPVTAGLVERKDDNGAPLDFNLDGMSDGQTKQAMGQMMKAVNELVETNEAKLTSLAKKGAADVITELKLDKLNGYLDKFEGMNSKLTTLEKNSEELKSIDKRFDVLEAFVNRQTAHGMSAEEKTLRVRDWAAAVHKATVHGAMSIGDTGQKLFNDIEAEYKALNVGTSTEGGYLAPIEFVREIIKAETLMSPVRSLVRVRQTGARALEIPKRTGIVAAQWVAELGTKVDTNQLNYGMEEIALHEFFAMVDLTQQMIEDAVFNMESEIATEASEQFAVAEGNVFVTGDGKGKPEGFLNHAEVVSVASGSALTIKDADGTADGLLKGLKYGLKSAYAANGTWTMNRTTMGTLRTMKDANKNYIWQPGIAQGRPNTIDGDPYVELPDMPSEGAGTTPIAYGDFRRAYTWVDRLRMEMLRDPYTQATSGKIRHIMRKRVGGRVMLGEAIRKLHCAAS